MNILWIVEDILKQTCLFNSSKDKIGKYVYVEKFGNFYKMYHSNATLS